MLNQMSKLFIALLFVLTLAQCNNKTIKVADTLKYQPNDPFKTTMPASNYFDIDSKQDNVVDGNNGTIVVCPKGCFKNSEGEIVEGNVKVELAEALSLDEMVFSNLTTTSNGEQLETDGMIYFNATFDG